MKIKAARNKGLVHNDLETIMRGGTVGGLPDGLESKYFAALSELAKAVAAKWHSWEVYAFDDLADNDEDEFLHVLDGA